jgi:hypothetical protein
LFLTEKKGLKPKWRGRRKEVAKRAEDTGSKKERNGHK